MKVPTLLFGLSLFGHRALSHPLDLPFSISQDEINDLGKRQSTIVPVTGISGTVQPRLEIRQMQSEQPNQFTLLLLALQKWEKSAQTVATSYYQISGIHGVPRQDYNGVGECSTCAGGNGVPGADGYCTHDSVLFPAWHRAYMALFEQQFVKVATNIANAWPKTGGPTTRAQMQAAAKTLRWPYWDWAAAPPNGGNNLPDAVSSPTIVVKAQTGQKTITNPLYSYHFSSESNLVYTPFKSWPNTLRYPTSDASSATSDESTCIANLNSIRATLQSQVYQLMSTCTDYLHFSNDKAGNSTTSCHNSLEGIHNTIHTTTGGVPSTSVATVGHMYYLSEAAFDPVFWLHHANVDRLFALWQTIQSSYGAEQVAPHNTWTIAKGTTQGPTSPLTPFYSDAAGTTFWTTDTVKDWTTFGYTYPEFADSNGSKAAIQSYVQALYGPSATATAGSSKRTAMPEPVAAPEAKPTSLGGVIGGAMGSILPGLTAPNGSTYEYVANIQAPRYSLGGSYYIFLFLGQPSSEDPSGWFQDPALVGPMGVLAQDTMKGVSVLIAGSIPITPKLSEKVQNGILSHLAPTLVEPFLESALQWRILGPNGTTIDPETVEGFEVSVYSSTATTPQTPYELPQWSEFVPLPAVTKCKKGGAFRDAL